MLTARGMARAVTLLLLLALSRLRATFGRQGWFSPNLDDPADPLSAGLAPQQLAPTATTADDSDDARWRRDAFADSGEPYWWRPGAEGMHDEPEVSLSEPADMWKLGETDSGAPYLWRTGPNDEPEVQVHAICPPPRRAPRHRARGGADGEDPTANRRRPPTRER